MRPVQPTTTVYMGNVEDGVIQSWALADGEDGTVDLTLPVAVSEAAGAASSGGLYLFGGRTADGLSDQMLFAATDATGALTGWRSVGELALPEPRAGATAASVGEFVYVLGGEGLAGPSSTVYRLTTDEGVPATTDEERAPGLGERARRRSSCRRRARRPRPSTPTGPIYVIGGVDASGAPADTTLLGRARQRDR